MVRVAMVGIGRLGRALVEQWEQFNQAIGVYHPTDAKVAAFVSQFNHAVPVSKADLSEMRAMILALPATKISEFLKENHNPNIVYVNMATALKTSELQQQFPDLQIVSMKFVGHAQDLYANGNGYFISEDHTPEDIVKLFTTIGTVRKADPEITNQVNKIATYYGIKAAVELEAELKDKNFDQALINRAIASVTPEVIKSYQKGDLGHFAQSVAEEVKKSIGS